MENSRSRILVFNVRDALFGLPVQNVREIVEKEPITPVPGAPPCLLGLARYRLAVIPVFDIFLLSAFSGEPPVSPGDSEFEALAILEGAGKCFGAPIPKSVKIVEIENGREETGDKNVKYLNFRGRTATLNGVDVLIADPGELINEDLVKTLEEYPRTLKTAAAGESI